MVKYGRCTIRIVWVCRRRGVQCGRIYSISNIILCESEIEIGDKPEPLSNLVVKVYFTGNTTYSPADTYPYVYIDKRLADRDVVIVADMGMRRVFPNFSNFLDKHMQPYKTTTYKTGIAYRYTRDIKPENRAVEVYVVKASKLWSLLEESH